MTARLVLSLYKQMLRKGRQLQLTDKVYYFRRIRDEFEINRNITNNSEIEHNIKKAEAFLKNNVLV